MISVLNAAVPAQAQIFGVLDISFGTGGKVTTPIGTALDRANAVAVQSGDKIVVAGYSYSGSANGNDFALARYTANGTLDTSFGNDGKATTHFGTGDDIGQAVAIQSDDKIVVAGYSYSGSANGNDFALARYTAGGALDTSFGTGGKVTTPIGSGDDRANAVAVQPDGKIVVVGRSHNGSDEDFALARYTANGTLDTSFGNDGKATIDIASGRDRANAVAVQLDNKILVAGQSNLGSATGNDFALVRYTANGTLDMSFSSDGKVTTHFSSLYEHAYAVAVQTDGKIVVAGDSRNDFALVRYTAAGSLDGSFGTGGKVTTDVGAYGYGRGLVAQSNGKILVAGWTESAGNRDFALVRYTAAGSLDGSFGTGGKVTTAFGSGDDYGRAVAVQTDGKVLVAGYSNNGSNDDFALARYHAGPPPPLPLSRWTPTMWVQALGGEALGCSNGIGGAECRAPNILENNSFFYYRSGYGNTATRTYRVKELYIEPDRTTAWGERSYRVVFTVDDDSGTAELGRGMSLVLTSPYFWTDSSGPRTGMTEKRLPFNAAERDGNTFTWPLLFSDGNLNWFHALRGVKVRIHRFTAGLGYVRVYYDEMRDGQPVDGFDNWRPAGVSAYYDGLIAYIPGEFPSIDPARGMVTTTHARLRVTAATPGSTLEWAEGNHQQATGSFAALGVGELTPAIELDAASKFTYAYIRVTNGDQVATHRIIIDPPPRTYTVSPQVSVTEGEEAVLTLSLGSPATAGGVSFTVAAHYGDGGAAPEDVGEITATVTVPEGRQSARIVVPTVDDEAVEDPERFAVRVAHAGTPAWAVDPQGTGTAVVTIADDDEPPEGPEPWDVRVVPGDGALTVSWRIGARDGIEGSKIWHALRWSQQPGVWANPRDPRAVGRNDGVSVDPGLTSYTITGLKNGVATGVFIRSVVGHRNNMSERDQKSSEWVRVKGEHTTPVAGPNDAPTVASPIADVAGLEMQAAKDVSLAGVFSDADGDALAITASSSDENVATVTVASDGSKLTLSGVAVGTATVTVTAEDSGGNRVSDAFEVSVAGAEPEQRQEAVQVPGPVTALELAATPNSVTVRWQAPDSGSAPKRYIVHLRPEGGNIGSGKTKTPKAKKTKVVFDNLEPGRTYRVWVRAQNEFGKGQRVHDTITLPA